MRTDCDIVNSKDKLIMNVPIKFNCERKRQLRSSALFVMFKSIYPPWILY